MKTKGFECRHEIPEWRYVQHEISSSINPVAGLDSGMRTCSNSKLPHALIEALPTIETVSELKVILYVLRHTWGYQEFGVTKRITLDEFQHGRKLRLVL